MFFPPKDHVWLPRKLKKNHDLIFFTCIFLNNHAKTNQSQRTNPYPKKSKPTNATHTNNKKMTHNNNKPNRTKEAKKKD